MLLPRVNNIELGMFAMLVHFDFLGESWACSLCLLMASWLHSQESSPIIACLEITILSKDGKIPVKRRWNQHE